MTASKRLATTIRLIPRWMNVQTVVARFTGVPGVNKDQFYPKLNALIDQELPQLVKAPTVTSTPLSLSSRQLVGALSNPAQVFKSNDLVLCFGFFNQLIADYVVLMCLKAFLLARQLFQQLSATSARTARAFRGFSLEFCSQIAVMVAYFSYLFSAISIILRGNNNISSTQIATQNFIRFWRQIWCRFKLNIQVIATIFSFGQSSRLGLLSFEQSKLVIANVESKALPPAQQSQANCPVFLSKTERSRVISCRSWSKTCNWFSIFFRRFSVAAHATNSMNSQLCGQTKPSPNVMVAKRLHSYFVSQFRIKSLIHVLASIRKRLQCFLNFGELFGANVQFAGYGQDLLHTPIISQCVNKHGRYKYGLQFLSAHEYMDEESLQQTVDKSRC